MLIYVRTALPPVMYSVFTWRLERPFGFRSICLRIHRVSSILDEIRLAPVHCTLDTHPRDASFMHPAANKRVRALVIPDPISIAISQPVIKNVPNHSLELSLTRNANKFSWTLRKRSDTWLKNNAKY